MRLQTQRLLLRPFRPDEAVELGTLLADPRVGRYLHRGPYSPARAEALAEGAVADAALLLPVAGQGLLAVEEGASATIVGGAGLQALPALGRERTEVTFLISPEHWQRGYATEAAGALVEYAIQILQLPEVVAAVRPENAASIRVLDKLGFRLNGITACYGTRLPLYTKAGAGSVWPWKPLPDALLKGVRP